MIKSVSTQQTKQVLDASHFLEVSADGPVNIMDIEGEVNSTTGLVYYIQLLNNNTPASGITVPMYSRLAVTATAVSGNNGFSFVYRPEGLDTARLTNPNGGTFATAGENNSPVYVAISSTDNVYTSVAASTQVAVNFDAPGLENINQTVTGDLTTGVDYLVVYADPNPANRLTKVQAKHPIPARFLMGFGYANPALGAEPLFVLSLPNANQLYTFDFGLGGLMTMQGDSTYIIHTGCYLYGSSTATSFTATTGNHWNIKAFNI